MSGHYEQLLRDIYADTDIDCSHLFDPEDDEEYDAESSESDEEEFTEAQDDSTFVRETHEAVRAMSERYCITDTHRQKSVRDFLNYLHYKYN
jgi:hypothetical protein